MSIQFIPAEARVTERKSQTIRMGRDDAPSSTLESLRTNVNGSPINRAGWSPMLAWTVDPETGFTTSGHVNPTAKDDDVLSYREQDDADAVSGVYRQRDGGIVRTVAMGDDALPTAGQVQTRALVAVAAGELTGKRADKIAARNVPSAAAQRDASVAAYLAGKGYTGPITAQIRSLALDALAFADQVAAMAS